MLERDLKLLKLKDSQSYLLDIVKTAAQRADQEKRFNDAILLYNLAEEYDSVVRILNLELGAALSRPSATSASAVNLSNHSDDIVTKAREILEHYDRMSGTTGKVGRKNRETCEVLLRLKEAMGLFEEGKIEFALAVRSLHLPTFSSFSSTSPSFLISRSLPCFPCHY
jgi:nuclear pore complex protein Nup93